MKLNFIVFRICFLLFIFSCNNKSNDKAKDINDPGPEVELNKPSNSKKIKLKRPTYSLEYDNDWGLDSTSVDDFDIDTHITFEPASTKGFIMFWIYNVPIDEDNFTDKHVKAQLKRSIKNGNVEYFTNWGNYKGSGAMITGKFLGVTKGQLKIFSYSGKNYSFTVLIQLFDSHKEEDGPGIKQIESSFRLND